MGKHLQKKNDAKRSLHLSCLQKHSRGINQKISLLFLDPPFKLYIFFVGHYRTPVIVIVKFSSINGLERIFCFFVNCEPLNNTFL